MIFSFDCFIVSYKHYIINCTHKEYSSNIGLHDIQETEQGVESKTVKNNKKVGVNQKINNNSGDKHKNVK